MTYYEVRMSDVNGQCERGIINAILVFTFPNGLLYHTSVKHFTHMHHTAFITFHYLRLFPKYQRNKKTPCSHKNLPQYNWFYQYSC